MPATLIARAPTAAEAAVLDAALPSGPGTVQGITAEVAVSQGLWRVLRCSAADYATLRRKLRRRGWEIKVSQRRDLTSTELVEGPGDVLCAYVQGLIEGRAQ